MLVSSPLHQTPRKVDLCDDTSITADTPTYIPTSSRFYIAVSISIVDYCGIGELQRAFVIGSSLPTVEYLLSLLQLEFADMCYYLASTGVVARVAITIMKQMTIRGGVALDIRSDERPMVIAAGSVRQVSIVGYYTFCVIFNLMLLR